MLRQDNTGRQKWPIKLPLGAILSENNLVMSPVVLCKALNGEATGGFRVKE